ncbi:hypothetical protein [Hamadaea flava]|uniref:hypothetical protein n=1 Tax=Hamadaea flava TaxID=1742688 RepID=UPI0020A569FB|nr:hypothetical protein [Hamadaea flava]
MDAFHVVVIAQPMDSVRQERARRGALQRLLWELDQLSVGLVLLDRRTDSLNRRDRALVDALRGSGVLRPTLVIDFAHSYNGIDGEILLWIPDIVAGAAAAAHGDGDRSFLDPMGHLVLEIPLELG